MEMMIDTVPRKQQCQAYSYLGYGNGHGDSEFFDQHFGQVSSSLWNDKVWWRKKGLLSAWKRIFPFSDRPIWPLPLRKPVVRQPLACRHGGYRTDNRIRLLLVQVIDVIVSCWTIDFLYFSPEISRTLPLLCAPVFTQSTHQSVKLSVSLSSNLYLLFYLQIFVDITNKNKNKNYPLIYFTAESVLILKKNG